MLISESWLREWVSPDLSTNELAELLTQAGLEVETITAQPTLGDKVVVGQITDITKHPDADKLNICKVDVGASVLLTIVCGAHNARKDLIAPVALVGAVLPDGMEIGAREVRGVASAGMICAESELGLADQSDGLMELDINAEIGIKIDDYLNLDDVTIDVDLTPDRGDCLSIAGVARDVAALSKAKLSEIDVQPVPASIDDIVSVELMAPEGCSRYTGRVMKNINLNAQTPDYMKEKLRRVGVRSISAVVDVTNYVMLELGQPMHAFDFNKIDGGIIVRLAKENEKLTLLDEQEIDLDTQMLVIADHKKAIALAGIMGGGNSEIDQNTSDILLEAAYFSPLTIAGKARALGMHTDASHRFERGVDSLLQAKAIERATQLLLEIVGGECGPVFEQLDQAHMPAIETISLRPERLRNILGLAVSDQTIKQHLIDLKMQVNDESMPWLVNRPSWRFDVTGEHDLVEEIGRLEGLDKIEPNFPTLRAKPYTSPETKIDHYTLKSWLASAQFREVVSYSFIDPADQTAVIDANKVGLTPVDLANPIASNMSQMRLSVLPGLLNAARANEQRHQSRVRLFEMGNIFSVDSDSDTGVQEQAKLAIIMGGAKSIVHWSEPTNHSDFYDLKGTLDTLFDRIGCKDKIEYHETDEDDENQAVLHPGQSANILLDGHKIGFIGALHPTTQQYFDLNQAYIVAQIDLAALLCKNIAEFSNLSKYPQSTRDIAILVSEEVLAGDILKEIRENGKKLLKKCELFDTYSGDNITLGKKSLAFSLSLQSDSESLGSDFVDEYMNNLLISLKNKFGATLRS